MTPGGVAGGVVGSVAPVADTGCGVVPVDADPFDVAPVDAELVGAGGGDASAPWLGACPDDPVGLAGVLPVVRAPALDAVPDTVATFFETPDSANALPPGNEGKLGTASDAPVSASSGCTAAGDTAIPPSMPAMTAPAANVPRPPSVSAAAAPYLPRSRRRGWDRAAGAPGADW